MPQIRSSREHACVAPRGFRFAGDAPESSAAPETPGSIEPRDERTPKGLGIFASCSMRRTSFRVMQGSAQVHAGRALRRQLRNAGQTGGIRRRRSHNKREGAHRFPVNQLRLVPFLPLALTTELVCGWFFSVVDDHDVYRSFRRFQF